MIRAERSDGTMAGREFRRRRLWRIAAFSAALMLKVTTLQIITWPDEREKWSNVASIRSRQRNDVGVASVIHLLKIMPAGPVDRLRSIDAFQHRVGHDARVAAVAVRERMNIDQPVMQPDCGFRRCASHARRAVRPRAQTLLPAAGLPQTSLRD